MMKTSLKAITAAALIGVGMLSLPSPAEAWRGWGCGWGCGWGPGIVGFGIGAVVGSALAAPRVYAGPPAYGPAAYGPPPWTPAWYTYCAQTYRSFNPHTGYFIGQDGQPYFCH